MYITTLSESTPTLLSMIVSECTFNVILESSIWFVGLGEIEFSAVAKCACSIGANTVGIIEGGVTTSIVCLFILGVWFMESLCFSEGVLHFGWRVVKELTSHSSIIKFVSFN